MFDVVTSDVIICFANNNNGIVDNHFEINIREYRRVIINGKSRETGNIGYTRHKTKTNKTKTQHNMWCTPLCTNNVFKT